MKYGDNAVPGVFVCFKRGVFLDLQDDSLDKYVQRFEEVDPGFHGMV